MVAGGKRKKVADMELNMVAEMEVDKVADKVADRVADATWWLTKKY